MEQITLHEALTRLAERLDPDGKLDMLDRLREYAAEDTLGGYSPSDDVDYEVWPMGSIWRVEGQIIYALVRATRPNHIVELGSYVGCSTSHIMAALERNREEGFPGKLTCVDVAFQFTLKKSDPRREFVTFVKGDGVAWAENDMPTRRVEMIVEDMDHSIASVSAVWGAAKDKLKKGGVIVSHDAGHWLIGQSVRDGIDQSGFPDPLMMLVAPSDCGLAVGVQP